MQSEVVSKSKSLQGITDLTLIAPIRPGLIDALDTRTYASRLRLLFNGVVVLLAIQMLYKGFTGSV